MRAADLGHQVVDLAPGRAHLDLGVDQAGRADDLLGHVGRVAQLVGAGRGRDEQHLRHPLQELVEPQRPVVERRGQPEPEARPASACATGRPRTCRRSAARSGATRRPPPGSRRGSSRAACAAACPPTGPRGSASSSRCRCRSPSRAASPCRTRCASAAGGPRASCPRPPARAAARAARRRSPPTAALDLLALHRVVRGRVDGEVVELGQHLAGHRVEVRDRLDLVAEQRDPVGRLHVGRLHLDHVAADAELAAAQHHVVARVLDRDQLLEDRLARPLVADRQEQHHLARSSPGEPMP